MQLSLLPLWKVWRAIEIDSRLQCCYVFARITTEF